MTTLNDMIEEVTLQVEGWSGDAAVIGTTDAEVLDSASGFTVGGPAYLDGSGFSPGLVEVGDELVYAQAFDRATSTFSGCLRGWRGTTAATHPAGTIVRSSPRYPRVAVRRAINDTIKSLHPRLSAVASQDFSSVGGVVRYQLPLGALTVLSVSYESPGATGVWVPLRRWRYEPKPGGLMEGSRAIEVLDAYPGRTVRVVYTAAPTELALLSDDFTDSGLEEWTREVVVAGAAYRLVSMVDAGLAGQSSVDQHLNSRLAPVGAVTDQAKFLLGVYEMKLTEAESRFQDLWPPARHEVW